MPIIYKYIKYTNILNILLFLYYHSMHTVSNALIEQLSRPMPAATGAASLTSCSRYLRTLLLCPSPASQVQ